MANRLKLRELLDHLKRHDRRFEIFKGKKSGKGSHFQVFPPDIAGEKKSYPLPDHGMNSDVSPGHLSAIIRRFNLPRNIFKS